MRSLSLLTALCLLGCPGQRPAEPPGESTTSEALGAPSEAPPPPVPTASSVRDVVLWHAYRGQEKTALEQAIAGFHASQSGVRVRVQAVPYEPYLDKIAISISRGQGPDVFIFAHNMVGAWVEEGLIEPLSARVQPELLTALLPQSVRALVYQQDLYGLPLAFKSLALFFDRSRLPKAPATMEALLAAVKPLQDTRRGVWGFVYEAGLLYHHAPWMHAFGGSVFGRDGAPALNTPEQVAALDYARALHVAHGVVPRGTSSLMLTSLFNNGKAIAVLNGPWFRAELTRKDYGVAPIPTVGGRISKPFLAVEAAFVSARSDFKDAAMAVAVYLAGPEGASPRALVGQQPVCHVPTLDEASKSDPVLGVFKAQAERSVLIPSRPELQLVWSTADAAINGAVFEGKSSADVLQRAQAKVEADIAKRGQ